MLEHEVDIKTRDGMINTFITHPEEGGPYPIILFLMDAPGKREELHDMARRIATTGYVVMLPNLYYRTAREFVIDGSTASREAMFGHMNSLSNSMVVEDCEALLDYGKTSPIASDGPVGTVGYCMSGPFAFAAAAQIPDRIKAAASFHGVRLCVDTPDSPHLDADKITGELYIGCAETDDWAPREMVDRLEAHLKSTNINSRVEWYPQTEHGFVFPLREGKYHKPSAERHWERLHGLFQRNLQ
ncbi:MAG: dienelactone hydrolase family protein [bacterium]|nr:dienelactone hydrolase family protein [Gammaproteobacteria bacterium]HIL95838.1 dienelactone hydrolase family protein [Pseudomonadales bacterium]